MHPRLRALLVSLGAVAVVSTAGVYLGQRDLWAPAPGVTNAELVDAGVMQCPVHDVKWRARKPPENRFAPARTVAQQGNVRVCPGQEGVASRAVRDRVAAGWEIVWVRDLGAAAGGESDPSDTDDECACSTGSNCTATAPDGGTGRTLPLWTIAGGTYPWQAPSAGCVRMPCDETSAGLEWPDTCPKP